MFKLTKPSEWNVKCLQEQWGRKKKKKKSPVALIQTCVSMAWMTEAIPAFSV